MGRVIYRWKALDNYISSILNVFAKSLWFKSSFEKTVFFKTKNANRILDSIFKPFIGIEQIRWRWKLVKIRIFHISIIFSNSIRFKSNLENGEILGEMYFCDFLQTVCRIDANYTALESYGKCTTFLYRNVFLIP